MRCHWRQGLLWPQLEPAKRTKASTARNLQPANSHDPPQSRNCFRSLQHPGLPPVPPLSRRRIPRPLHPFGRRSAVTPILGGLQLRGSKRRRQLKTAKKNTKTKEISRRWQAFPEEVRARLPPRVCASSRPHFSAVARCPCSFEAEGAIRPLQVVVVVADNCLRGFATPPIG